MNVICFDLEGPISPQDNAYEVLGLTRDGDKVFEVISKYDDLLTLEGRSGYEPGDTLKLIVPFLLYHNISERDIIEVSKTAKIIPGIKETISSLRESGWKVFIISTSYSQHAINIATRIGVPQNAVACTKLPLDTYHKKLKSADFRLVEDTQKRILEELYPPEDEKRIVKVLDDFFFKGLSGTRLGQIFNEVRVIGGIRKVKAMDNFVKGEPLKNVIAVGDSITDFKMLKKVRDEGGLAVAFNGNEYSIPYANVGLASTDQRFLLPLTDAFENGGKKGVAEVLRQIKGKGPGIDCPFIPAPYL